MWYWLVNIIYTVHLGKRRSRTGSGIYSLTHPDAELKQGHSHVTFAIHSSRKKQKRQWSHWQFHNSSPNLSPILLNLKECYALLTCSAVRHQGCAGHTCAVQRQIFGKAQSMCGCRIPSVVEPMSSWGRSSAVHCDLSSPSMLISEPSVALRNWWYLRLNRCNLRDIEVSAALGFDVRWMVVSLSWSFFQALSGSIPPAVFTL